MTTQYHWIEEKMEGDMRSEHFYFIENIHCMMEELSELLDKLTYSSFNSNEERRFLRQVFLEILKLQHQCENILSTLTNNYAEDFETLHYYAQDKLIKERCSFLSTQDKLIDWQKD